jgi:N-acylneuraminate cytidylyltransferase
MLTYPVRSAIDSNLFDHVIVSTEDDEIAGAAEDAGATVIKRPEELASDRSRVVQVCKHVLDQFHNKGGGPQFFCCIYATAIFIKSEDIIKSFELFSRSPEPDFVMGVSEFNLQPVQALEEHNGFLKAKWPEYVGVQSQFHPNLVASNGTLYWARTGVFLKTQSFYGKKLLGYKIPKFRTVDLDSEEDLKFARILAEKLL